MRNLRMQEKLDANECLDVRVIGTEVNGLPGIFELVRFTEDIDYCDALTESWIWYIGRRLSDGKIFATIGTDLYGNSDYECLWLR